MPPFHEPGDGDLWGDAIALIEEGGRFVLSPSDLVASAGCAYGWLRSIDIRLGWAPPVEVDEDPLAETIARLGDDHEAREARRFTEEGRQLVTVPRPTPYTRAGLSEAAEATRSLLTAADAPDVVGQAAFFDGSFGGFADFIVREGAAYAVWDVKLARSARVEALLQIAAYADGLDAIGVPRTRHGYLRLGDRSVHTQMLDDVIPVYRRRRSALERALNDHLDGGTAVAWGDERHSICGACAHCEVAIAEHDDVLQVAGLGRPHRLLLREAGIVTLPELAAASEPVPGISLRMWSRLQAQAEIQDRGRRAGDGTIPHEVFDPAAIRALPAPDPGDVFFDFEGDPLWATPDGVADGLEYLFGIVDLDAPDGRFIPFWAHDRAEEKEALRRFLDYVDERRVAHPGLHIYHYAPYETSALKRLTVRHGLGEDQLDDLLRAGVFVDLYATVRQSIRVAQPSYSIKKLEPLYMGDELRSAEGVTDGLDSVVQYHRFCAAREAGNDAEATRLLDDIGDYNRYDCVSTWRLRDWLLSQVDREAGGPRDDEADVANAADEKDKQLRLSEIQGIADEMLLGIPEERGERSKEQQGVALLAAALGFYRREAKPMWWEYFDRCVSPVDEWLESRGTLVAESVEVIDDWTKATPRASTFTRTLRIVGELDVGTTLKPGTEVRCIYEEIPPALELGPGDLRVIGWRAVVTAVDPREDGRSTVDVEEKTAKGWEAFTQRPMAVFEHTYFPNESLENAVIEIADRVRTTESRVLPRDAACDILACRPPRLRSGTFDASHAGIVDETSLVETLTDLDNSYVAVQGPPGTGKTYVGSRAVAELVRRGWKVGVVGQSHAVAENFLESVIVAGVAPERVGKKPNGDAADASWTAVKDPAAFVAEDGGRVLGGTAWTFASPKVRGLDLLVIDEAGQFSLAHTIAASRAASRLLLLGDPQQLPQVSKGSHPEPVGTSALEWLVQGNHTMPPDLGYFLSRSWRMHSHLTRHVSDLAYDGRLFAKQDVTDGRSLMGIKPGLHPFVVDHAGNSVVSEEEAATVVDIVRCALDSTWADDSDADPRPVAPDDLIVVAPYNAQVAAIRRRLDEAGFTDTQVGTVDRFQGREAPIAVMSMTASSAQDVPRGIDFLLDRQRLNVAISRAQWATFVVHSPALLDSMPTSIGGLERLGAFLRLVEDNGAILANLPSAGIDADSVVAALEEGRAERG